LSLLAHSARRNRALLGAAMALLVAFQALAGLMAASFQESDYFEDLAALVPDFLRQTFGASFFALISFHGIVLLGFFHFAVIAFLVGLAVTVATEPASEVEHRFNDLLLARPLPRSIPIARSALLLVLTALATSGAMCAGTWIGLVLFAPEGVSWPGARLILTLGGVTAALMICFGGLALAFASGARRRGGAGAVAGLLAFASFLLNLVAGVWEPARPLERLSPFHYFQPMNLVGGQPLDWTQPAVLLGIGAAGVAVALLVYGKRDL
jgi:hypothetical protein